MAKKFEITRGNAILNFSEEFCQSRCELVESESFAKVLEKFIKNQHRLESQLYVYLNERNADDMFLLGDLRSIFKLMLVLDADQICALRPEYAAYFDDRDMFVKLIEDIYLYWRKLQRYAIVFNDSKRAGYQNVQFADAQEAFEKLVLEVYRSMQKAVGKNDKVLRQITAGVNAGLTVTHLDTALPDDYDCLKNVPFIEQVVIHPPFITYSKRNKRDGVFPEDRQNPVTDLTFNPDQWL